MGFYVRSQPSGHAIAPRGAGAKVVKREREEDLSPHLFLSPVFPAPSRSRARCHGISPGSPWWYNPCPRKEQMSPEERPAPAVRRDLEIVPVVYEGERCFLVRDGLGLIEPPVILKRDALAVLALLDGRRSVEDIRVELVRRRGGTFIAREAVETLLAELDAARVLDSPGFRRAQRKFVADYARLEVREAVLAGSSYPARAEDLARYLDRLLECGDADGPAADPAAAWALVAPHIELETGKALYAKAYGSVRGLAPERIILLGTGHHLDDGYFSLTDKDFETPLGRVRTDREAVAALRAAGGEAVSPSDIAHRREHSLEFQIIFLQRLFGPSFSIVPVLCGSFQQDLERASRPAEVPGVSGVVAALGGIIRDGGPRTLTVAGVDLSHIGPKFGHAEDAVSLLVEAREHDRILIEAACRQDVAGFWAETRRVGDRTNVCGFSSLAVLLEALPPVRGTVLGYEFWREEETRSAVSYASILFERAGSRALEEDRRRE
jgi:MEMO1 family protein